MVFQLILGIALLTSGVLLFLAAKKLKNLR